MKKKKTREWLIKLSRNILFGGEDIMISPHTNLSIMRKDVLPHILMYRLSGRNMSIHHIINKHNNNFIYPLMGMGIHQYWAGKPNKPRVTIGD